jgi:hypothetical protein
MFNNPVVGCACGVWGKLLAILYSLSCWRSEDSSIDECVFAPSIGYCANKAVLSSQQLTKNEVHNYSKMIDEGFGQ